MLKTLRRKVLPTVAFLVGALLVLALFEQSPLQAGLEFQSELPLPKPPANPNFVPSADGGRIYCGLQQSPVWLDISSGFTSEGGAEFHCDPIGSLSEWVGTPDAWDDRGYLIGFWPTETPIIKPPILTFEIDPARAGSICNSCFTARYYDSGSGQWQGLPTTYDTAISRVEVQITEYLPTSGYPGYADRFVIALFTRSAPTPTSRPTSPPTLTAVPPVRPTSTPLPTRVVETPTSAPRLSPTTAVPTPASTPTSTSTPICPCVGMFAIVLIPLVSAYLRTNQER